MLRARHVWTRVMTASHEQTTEKCILLYRTSIYYIRRHPLCREDLTIKQYAAQEHFMYISFFSPLFACGILSPAATAVYPERKLEDKGGR
jgi:hypothetical protein